MDPSRLTHVLVCDFLPLNPHRGTNPYFTVALEYETNKKHISKTSGYTLRRDVDEQ